MSQSELSAAISLWEVVGKVGFVMVIIGVALEGSELVVRWGWKNGFRKRFTRVIRRRLVSFVKMLRPKILPVETIGFLVLVAGLAIEFIGTNFAARLQGEANARLNREASIARKEAGIANQHAEELQRKNLELETRIAPRRIEGVVKVTLVANLSSRGIGVGPIIIDSESREPEVVIFRKQIEEVFAEAKISVISRKRGISITETVVSEGLIFRVKAGERPSHAIQIQKAFEDVGVAIVSQEDQRVQSGTLEIWVGIKPIQ
jgi:hypothetical protein